MSLYDPRTICSQILLKKKKAPLSHINQPKWHVYPLEEFFCWPLLDLNSDKKTLGLTVAVLFFGSLLIGLFIHYPLTCETDTSDSLSHYLSICLTPFGHVWSAGKHHSGATSVWNWMRLNYGARLILCDCNGWYGTVNSCHSHTGE